LSRFGLMTDGQKGTRFGQAASQRMIPRSFKNGYLMKCWEVCLHVLAVTSVDWEQ